MKNDMVSRDWADRLVHAHDASVYRLIPRAVARPRNIHDVQNILLQARSENAGVTFRAGGTSLSGQAVTRGFLVVLGRDWDTFRVHDNGFKLTCGPALRGAVANAALSRYGRRIGPDPASIQAACLGGIVANNASGMCCGVEENSYRTIDGLKVLFASGSVLDTREADCDAKFRQLEPHIYDGLMNLRDKVLSSPRLVALIRKKNEIKNTTGYGLQAFLDYRTPADLLSHLLVGSEGTLAFIAEMTLRTVPLRPHRASALLSFNELGDACEAAPRLKDLGFSAIELFDYTSVQTLRSYPQLPDFLKELNSQGACLLIQAQQDDRQALDELLGRAGVVKNWRQIAHHTDFFDDDVKQNQLWDLRKGIFPAVGARRPRGTSVIIEDVAFPLVHLADGTRALRKMLEKHEYRDAVIYGHARDGNLHFVLAQDFAAAGEIKRYERFIDDMVECVAGQFGGSLKAEHGTGRNMAPFVEMEWGSEAYLLMRELKSLFDPENLLNPDVLINSNPRAHLQNLKETPRIDGILDPCIECGFCEPVCPSQGLTLSPRGRIVLQRERAMESNQGSLKKKELDYLQLETCAADGLCAKACPVGINTGSWVKAERAREARGVSRALAQWSAAETAGVESAAKWALTGAQLAQNVVGSQALEKSTRVLNSIFGLPVWKRGMGMQRSDSASAATTDDSGGRRCEELNSVKNADSGVANKEKFVVVRSCLTRSLQQSRTDPLEECALRAGVDLAGVNQQGLCCGQPWSSKGHQQEAGAKLEAFIEACFAASESGKFPVVIDNSPCALAVFEDSAGLSPAARGQLEKLKILDPTDFALHLAKRLPLKPLKDANRFFPVCSVVKSGRLGRFEELAKMICDKPVLPLQSACCGMAGDRGLWFPELTENAKERFHWSPAEMPAKGFCTSRTCEMALSEKKISFESIFAALEQASRPDA